MKCIDNENNNLGNVEKEKSANSRRINRVNTHDIKHCGKSIAELLTGCCLIIDVSR